jgi:hypothetical protein
VCWLQQPGTCNTWDKQRGLSSNEAPTQMTRVPPCPVHVGNTFSLGFWTFSSFFLTWKFDRILSLRFLFWWKLLVLATFTCIMGTWEPALEVSKGAGNVHWQPVVRDPISGVGSPGKLRCWMAQRWPAIADGKNLEPSR